MSSAVAAHPGSKGAERVEAVDQRPSATEPRTSEPRMGEPVMSEPSRANRA